MTCTCASRFTFCVCPSGNAPAAPAAEADKAAWWVLVMGAAASIEDAANCLRDPDAKRQAEGAMAHFRAAAQKLYAGAAPAAEPDDHGPWYVSPDGRTIQSDDFTHDVALRVTGDFADDAQRKDYADRIAARLAAPGAAPAQSWEPLTDEQIDRHIGIDEDDREAVAAIVREVEAWHGIGSQP